MPYKSLVLLSLLLPCSFLRAQCNGVGDAVLEIRAVANTGNNAGDKFVVRIVATPNSHVCFLCDLSEGPTKLDGIGTFCLGFTKDLQIFTLFVGPTGVLEIPITLPSALSGKLLCCQWIGLNAKMQFQISNSVCIRVDSQCEGGLKNLGLVTAFDTVTEFPVAVSVVIKDKGGKQLGKTTLSFNPATPASFPVTDDGIAFIDKLTNVGGKFYVLLRVDGSTFGKGGKLKADTAFEVSVGKDVHAEQIHTSCSKPIGIGFVFDEFTITSLTDVGRR